jgi:hypothetical protein
VRTAERLLTVLRQASATIALSAADSSAAPTDTGLVAVAADSARAAAPPADAAPTVAVPVKSARATSSPTAVGGGAPDARPAGDGGLRADVGERLAALPSVRDAYPMAPVVVTLGGYRQSEVADSLVDVRTPAPERRARQRLVARSTTDERLVAEWAVARAALPAGSATRRELAALVQAAAVTLRPWAQAAVEPAPGADTATVPDLVDVLRLRDGVRAVTFEPAVPAAWRPVAVRQLGRAVADLRRVFPHLTLDGLTVRLAESPRRGLALALHEPRSRTVYLPPATGAGTVAHELVHDLDAQAAQAQLAVRGVYGTDRLTRTGGSGDLARAVRALAATTPSGNPRNPLGSAPPTALAFDPNRPAERLARGADFFVAAALAREGRSNGVLSAVQDAVLTGFAGVTAPEPGDGAAEALVSVLDQVTLVPPATRQWYLARFGAMGVRSPLAVAQFALKAQPAWDGERTLRALGLPSGLAAVPGADAVGEGLLAPCGGGGRRRRRTVAAAAALARGRCPGTRIRARPGGACRGRRGRVVGVERPRAPRRSVAPRAGRGGGGAHPGRDPPGRARRRTPCERGLRARAGARDRRRPPVTGRADSAARNRPPGLRRPYPAARTPAARTALPVLRCLYCVARTALPGQRRSRSAARRRPVAVGREKGTCRRVDGTRARRGYFGAGPAACRLIHDPCLPPRPPPRP